MHGDLVLGVNKKINKDLDPEKYIFLFDFDIKHYFRMKGVNIKKNT